MNILSMAQVVLSKIFSSSNLSSQPRIFTSSSLSSSSQLRFFSSLNSVKKLSFFKFKFSAQNIYEFEFKFEFSAQTFSSSAFSFVQVRVQRKFIEFLRV